MDEIVKYTISSSCKNTEHLYKTAATLSHRALVIFRQSSGLGGAGGLMNVTVLIDLIDDSVTRGDFQLQLGLVG